MLRYKFGGDGLRKSPGCPSSGLGLSVGSVLQDFSNADTVPCPGVLFVLRQSTKGFITFHS